MNNQPSVLIVGAGPTGLMMACELARHGVSFTLIDKKSERIKSSNATWIQPRTLEIFDQIGIASQFIRTGHSCRAINLYIAGKLLTTIPLNHIDSKYAYVLLLPQSDTEKLLTERLKQLQHEIERSCELIDIKMEENSVVSTVRTADGKTKNITSQWVIACDGADSTMRDKSQISFLGNELNEQFVVADAKIDSYIATNEIHLFFDKGTVFAASPLSGSKYRITANIHQSHPRRAFYDKEVIDLIQERSHGVYYIKDISWVSPFWIHCKCVEKLRQGPIFFVGDAAHLHSPAGGQGMNTGIQDAFNLAWKLALVIQGKAKSALLDSYHSERYPIINEIVNQTDAFTRMVLDKSFLTKLRKFSHEMQNAEVDTICNALAQLSIQYKDSPIIDYRNQSLQGTRAPDVVIHASVRLYDYLRNREHNAFLFSDTSDKINELQQKVQKNYPDLIKVHVISKQPLHGVENNIVDVDGMLHKHFQVSSRALLIVRPDGYIGFFAKEFDESSIDDYMGKILN